MSSTPTSSSPHLSRHWTADELEIVDRLYERASQVDLLEQLPGRSWGSIRAKGKRKKLKRIPRKTWTDGETFTLRRMYPKAPKADILHSLPARTWHAITTEACRLKIARRSDWADKRIPRNMKPPKNNLLRDLISRRMQSGLTQKELAEVIGWSGQAQAGQYERGEGISLFQLQCWCDALGMELRAVHVGPAKKSNAKKNMTPLMAADVKTWWNEQRNLKKGMAA